VSAAVQAEQSDADALRVGTGVSVSPSCVNAQTGTTYDLVASDDGKVITLNNAAAVTVNLPNNLPVGFQCMCVQLGAGQVGFSPGVSVTLRQRQTQYKIAGQYGIVSLMVLANAGGSAAVYYLAGDTAA